MDKNEKLHNGTAPELNEEQLDSVSGGAAGDITGWKDDYCETCKKTTSHYLLHEGYVWQRKQICTVCNSGRIVWLRHVY